MKKFEAGQKFQLRFITKAADAGWVEIIKVDRIEEPVWKRTSIRGHFEAKVGRISFRVHAEGKSDKIKVAELGAGYIDETGRPIGQEPTEYIEWFSAYARTHWPIQSYKGSL